MNCLFRRSIIAKSFHGSTVKMNWRRCHDRERVGDGVVKSRRRVEG